MVPVQFPEGDVPDWVCRAMEVADIDISMCRAPQSAKTTKVQFSMHSSNN